jgi:dipeptidyl aminopeptidase/acylaminoacyl peptidase
MTRVAGPRDVRDYREGAATSDFAVFSPDGKRFVVVVRKGNLEQNTMEYSLLLFATAKVFDGQAPRHLATFASSSYDAGISDVQWLDDNDTILFLGERVGETTQLYSVRCSSGKVGELTHRRINVVGYGASADGKTAVVGIETPVRNLFDANALRNGFTVSTEDPFHLEIGRRQECCQDMFIIKTGKAASRPLHVQGEVWQDPLRLFISPNGRYLVVRTYVTDPPDQWLNYEDDYLRKSIVNKQARMWRGEPPSHYELIDLQTGVSQTLLNSPVGLKGSEVAWAPDSRSVILTDVYLSLDVQAGKELEARKSHTFVVEVSVPELGVTQIANHDMELVGWDSSKRFLKFIPGRWLPDRSRVVYYQKKRSAWDEIPVGSVAIMQDLPEIAVAQDLNTPPRIIARDSKTTKEATILDLNPQFRDLAFGKVQEVKWIGGAGREVEGGLYLPPDYVPGRRYPLVIQTHGFDPHGFWVDGPFTTAFAAQPLAANGMIVLQVPSSSDFESTPEEAPGMMETYEKAIDYLDGRGFIDREKVGIIGFSRTCFHVKYMLTHSKYRLAAATVADGIDGGYFQYIGGANEPLDAGTAYAEKVSGAQPFGEGLLVWLERSPGFLLQKVHTPIRAEAHGLTDHGDGGGITSEWEWFAGLSRLRKPVELFYLPEAGHVLDRPLERMASQQGDVDWFSFWLKNEEDSDPLKAEQYARWRELRKLRQSNEAGSKPN